MAATSSVVLHAGYAVLRSSADGSITSDPEGLYDYDTRVLSRHRLLLGGQAPVLVSADQPESDAWLGILQVPRPGGDSAGDLLPQDALEVDIRRRLGHGLLEEIVVRNRSAVRWYGELELELDGDFADSAEVGRARQQEGRIERRWDPIEKAVVLAYVAEHKGRELRRALRVRVVEAGAKLLGSGSGISFSLELGARAESRALLAYDSLVDGAWRSPSMAEHSVRAAERTSWRSARLTVEGHPALEKSFATAADDLFDLRNREVEDRFLTRARGQVWFVNAGVPTFTGIFGRDSITAGWQAMMIGPEFVRGALEVAAKTQATQDDSWRDAEPGKMIHEMRRGPISELGIGPRDAYYGTQTTPAMFLIGLSELWHWTGDTELLWRYLPAALAAMEWAERYGDRDDDGFLEYARRSPRGLKNQGWKDSDEAIRYPDGSIVADPIATVEEQAFHFIALQRMAEVLVALGMDERAAGFLADAADLQKRWHDAFWMADERFYALALDPEKQQVRTITSNPGHALGSGIVPCEHAREVADRLFSPDLFSGWGIRTLSSNHPSYNPFAYHLGTVWPVENATFALGLKRYGLDEHVGRLADAMFEAAAGCPDSRLPEALSGHDRSESSRPIHYPNANSPQAWSASALIQLVQIMLGIYPFAPLGVLALVRPRLPSWVPRLTVRNLRIGNAQVDLRFDRRDDGSAGHRVLRQDGRLLVLTAGPPNDVGTGPVGEAVKRLALEHLPGRLAKAARIGIGLDL
jgi:glycogen debranching enzyme